MIRCVTLPARAVRHVARRIAHAVGPVTVGRAGRIVCWTVPGVGLVSLPFLPTTPEHGWGSLPYNGPFHVPMGDPFLPVQVVHVAEPNVLLAFALASLLAVLITKGVIK